MYTSTKSTVHTVLRNVNGRSLETTRTVPLNLEKSLNFRENVLFLIGGSDTASVRVDKYDLEDGFEKFPDMPTPRYSTVQYITLQYNTVQYSTVQYSTVQFSIV